MITFPPPPIPIWWEEGIDKRRNRHNAIMSAPLPTTTNTSDPPHPSPPLPLPPPLPPATDATIHRLPGHRRRLLIQLVATGGYRVRGREDRVELAAMLYGACSLTMSSSPTSSLASLSAACSREPKGLCASSRFF